ncbi:MAG: galactitol-1-phosphate 5-dehydrogenase, partial [Candidatus Neoclostridium sp.]
NDAIEKIQPFGRLILIGNAGDDVTVKKETYAKILRKQLRISGSWNSDFSKAANDWKDSVYAISEKRIDPEMLITHKFTLKDSDKAFQTIKNKESYVKIMVVE